MSCTAQEGETLADIAYRYGIGVQDLKVRWFQQPTTDLGLVGQCKTLHLLKFLKRHTYTVGC